MRTARELDAEEWILSSPEGQRLLAEAATVSAPGPAEIARWRRDWAREEVEAALRLSQARRRGAAKFSRADRMWLDPIGLEQATPEPVARYKARRFAGENVVDLCSGIGGDALALGVEALVTCVDADDGMCRRLRWNAGVYEVSDRVNESQAQAREFPIVPASLVHADPDRRANGPRRAQSLSDYEPDLGFLLSLASTTRGGAIKLGPASDFASHFGEKPVEIELISLGGECKEATVWYGSLASCRRRATALPSGATWSDRHHLAGAPVPCSEVQRWVFDPDPALLRSGLLESFAAAHELTRVAPGVGYLTGPSRLDSPFVSAFEVRETLPLDLRRLKRVLAERKLGPLEIKVRGLSLRPESLRVQLSPPGPNPATLLLVGGGGPARVILAERPGRSSLASGRRVTE
ncbi:MAG: class I SAM-dependent methyltransferase [Isosphaeraceae bacterium]|nr:class I SAM-dependent methyltransferase [Isosphaeraceae bacterium]